LRRFSFGGYGLALVVFGAYDNPSISGRRANSHFVCQSLPLLAIWVLVASVWVRASGSARFFAEGWVEGSL